MADWTRHRSDIGSLVGHVLGACEAGALVRAGWPRSLDGVRRAWLLGIGKASGPMARAAASMLGERLAGGLVLGADETVGSRAIAGVDALGVDHPLATSRNIDAAGRVEAMAGALGEEDTLLLLLSGGSSAHLTLPAEGLALEDLRVATDALLRAGATIDELNCVRKHCERLKGGRLAAAAWPARVVALVLSDVVGDRLDVIGSGPVVGDPTTYADALAVLERRGVVERCPGVAAHLRRGVGGRIEETPKPGDPRLGRVGARIVGGRETAIDAAVAWARGRGFTIRRRDPDVTGESAAVGRELVRGALAARAGRPAAWMIAGETTVSGVGAGARGGPAMELALAGAIELDGRGRTLLVSLATDGVDGSSDGAGAWVTGASAWAMRRAGIDASAALEAHGSERALDAIGGVIRTGPTGTNVNDLGVLLAYE
jgi:hydroxypyruvate reductase